MSAARIAEEAKRRRTFAIISHPDAGKTTLTEKLLLYGGAVQLAGSVTARKNQRSTTSDWMELERQRGISVSSTVLQFDYAGYKVNLLDTPGHKDFSEDTYRVLTAVDAAIMVIDAGKGIEAQTRKLFEVCRMRGVPIFTFINKLDRPAREPLALLDELESVLGIGAFPVNWPLGTGFDFKGVYDRLTRQMHLFERTTGGAYRAPVEMATLEEDTLLKERLDEATYAKVREEIDMLEIAGEAFDPEQVLAGKITPVFFGSAANNFGVQLLLEGFLKYSATPAPRGGGNGLVPIDSERFSGFVFKIQANMDPRHRDRIAFLRVCSGIFKKDMQVTHSRTGKKVRLSYPQKVFAQERETVEEAFPGDIVGLVGHDGFGIGDTLTEDPEVRFNEIPRFAPEHFASLRNPNTAKFKQFRQGLEQLLQEGVIQVFHLRDAATRVPLLGAVGPLQFEVVQYRLQAEYGAESTLETASWSIVKWVPEDAVKDVDTWRLPTGSRLAEDTDGRLVILFPNEWTLRYFRENHAGLELQNTPSSTRPLQV